MTRETPPRDESQPRTGDTDRLVAELREAVRVRDEFLSKVAHELRNAVTPIVMQVQSLLHGARRGDENWRETAVPKLERLQHAADRYVRRASMLLDLSRLTSGHRRLEWAEVDVSATVRDAMREQEALAEFTGTDLTSDIQDAVLGTLDQLAVEQVAANLISNAIKYGGGEPVHVSLSADAGVARLIVRDRGSGISAEDQARIFGQFERAVARKNGGGFGVGLWLVSQLVSAMRGDVTVESRAGSGSIFTVTLPLRPMPQQEPT